MVFLVFSVFGTFDVFTTLEVAEDGTAFGVATVVDITLSIAF